MGFWLFDLTVIYLYDFGVSEPKYEVILVMLGHLAVIWRLLQRQVE